MLLLALSDYGHVSYQTAVSGWHDLYILAGQFPQPWWVCCSWACRCTCGSC